MQHILFLLCFIKLVSSQIHKDDDLSYFDESYDSKTTDDVYDIFQNINDDFLNINQITTYISSFFERNLLTCDTQTTNKLVDWTNVYTSQVKNAGLCLNAGWAFAAVEQVESDTLRLYGSTYKYILSVQQLLDCVSYNNGCNGGKIEYAYTYLLTSGLEQANNYPYASFFNSRPVCDINHNLAVTKLSGYYNRLSGNEACMASYVQKNGPITVCLSASPSWYTYSGGIMTLNSCPATSNINHCLQVVGVYPSVNGGYWKLKNSFGTLWGESGYIRLAYGSNVCNIINNPIYTTTIVDL